MTYTVKRNKNILFFRRQKRKRKDSDSYRKLCSITFKYVGKIKLSSINVNLCCYNGVQGIFFKKIFSVLTNLSETT